MDARDSCVIAQFVRQGLVQPLHLDCGWSHIRISEAACALIEDTVHARARPSSHAQEGIIDKAQRVKPQHRRTNPTVNRDVRRSYRGMLARKRRDGWNRGRAAQDSQALQAQPARTWGIRRSPATATANRIRKSRENVRARSSPQIII